MTPPVLTAHEWRSFVLCADDFAMTIGVSKAILALLAAERITATSAMPNRPHWKEQAAKLREHSAAADMGVHLTLTCGQPLGAMGSVAPDGAFPPLAVLGRRAASSALARAEIADEIERQLEAFEKAMGRSPDFLDGHQHVHVLPGIRGAMLAALARRYGAALPYIRMPSDSLKAIRMRGLFQTKALVVRALTSGFGRAAHRHGLRINHGFSGFSDFNAERSYGEYFCSYLIAPGRRHLIMCHPGHVDDELRTLDPVLGARQKEFNFLMSDAFPEMLKTAKMRLARFKELNSN